MLNHLFENVLNLTSDGGTTLTLEGAMICTVASLILGVLVALLYMFRTDYTKNFVITLALLPAIVQIVIMLVNGRLGAGLAVMGAFSLVRFRSLPGTAKEIGSIFLSMALGLATGMGYIGYALMFLILIGAASILLDLLHFGEKKNVERELKITIPEDLDYETIFDDLFDIYTSSHRMIQVKTTNLGSMFELKYMIRMKAGASEKEFIDAIRCRNGNLNIVCAREVKNNIELL